jgi:DNA-binding NarL/FixJ family response regulator
MSFTGAFWTMAVAGVSALLLTAAGMYLLFALKPRVRRLEEQAARSEESAVEVANLRAELQKTQAGLRELEAARPSFTDRIPDGAGINMNRQGQVLRLHRRGESIAGIASALRLSGGEVALTLKVHELNQKFLAVEAPENSLVFSQLTDKSKGRGQY